MFNATKVVKTDVALMFDRVKPGTWRVTRR